MSHNRTTRNNENFFSQLNILYFSICISCIENIEISIESSRKIFWLIKQSGEVSKIISEDFQQKWVEHIRSIVLIQLKFSTYEINHDDDDDDLLGLDCQFPFFKSTREKFCSLIDKNNLKHQLLVSHLKVSKLNFYNCCSRWMK